MGRYFNKDIGFSHFEKVERTEPVKMADTLTKTVVPSTLRKLPADTSTVTLTFGDQAENHVGMQKIGQLAASGFNYHDLFRAKELLEKAGVECELISLHHYCFSHLFPMTLEAYILIIREGANYLLEKKEGPTLQKLGAATIMKLGATTFIKSGADDLLAEQLALDHDKKAYMYGRVVNKWARHNLCFAEVGQEPDYEQRKGRIVPYSQVPLTATIRQALPSLFGEKAKDLVLEANYYYDITKCGIGFHGDAERRKVVAVRLGASLPLHYQWFQEGKPVGQRIKLLLHHGDMYVMSEKAVGTDWRKRKILTLRHAAGCEKFLKIKGSLG